VLNTEKNKQVMPWPLMLRLGVHVEAAIEAASDTNFNSWQLMQGCATTNLTM